MTYEAKVPLRISFAGGGSDVSPYSNLYGGAVLNAAIALYARCSIALLDEPVVIFTSADKPAETQPLSFPIGINGNYSLAKGVINRLHKEYGLPAQGFRIATAADAPIGSGLGTSSTLVVAILSAFARYLHLDFDPYFLANLAYDIERNDLGFAGGRQDQFAAAFGGINYMEFRTDDSVNVTPVLLPQKELYLLQSNLLLYYTSVSRNSGDIIVEQQKNVRDNNLPSVTAMHRVKAQAADMHKAFLSGDINSIGALLDAGFSEKKKMAANISNPLIESIYEAAKNAGASGGKISGAGGGGFMFFYCPNGSRGAVAAALNTFGGREYPLRFCFAQPTAATINK